VAAGALKGMSLVAAGLIVATALRLAGALSRNAMGVPACAAWVLATVVAIGVMRWSLVLVLPVLGLAAWGLARWRLGRPAP
jgi:chromate transporter